MATDIKPAFTVVDFNGAHDYSGQVLNASCVETWPEFSRLTLKLEASFNQSGLLDTYDTTLDLIGDDGTPLLCVRAWLTPEVRPWIRLLSFWLPIFTFILAVFVAFWPIREHEHHWVSRNTAHRITRVADMMAYMQFSYFSGALTLRYPGFFQPLVGPSSWSTLMLSMGPVTMDSPYAGVADGIYEINGTMTGEPGLEILTQITGSPVKPKSWLNTLVLALILFFLLYASIHVSDMLSRRGSTNLAENSEGSPQDFWSLLKRRFWIIARVFLSYFLLPLSAWSTYQFADAGRLIPKDSTMAILVFMLLLLTIWWSLSRAQGSLDIGLLLLQHTSRSIDETHTRKRYALVIFSLMLVRGVIIGGLQRYTIAQVSILLACELAHLVSMAYWTSLPSLLSLSGILQGSRLVILSLHLGFYPGVAGHPERVFLAYVILSGYFAILIGIFLIPIGLDIVRLILVTLSCKGTVVDAEKATPARSVSPSKSDRSAKFELSLLPPESPSDHHQYLAEKILGRDTTRLTDDQPDSITLADLSAFMKDVQGEDYDSNYISSRLSSGLVDFKNNLAEISPASHKTRISALVDFLLTKDNSAIRKTPRQYDLNRPINEYFICSSHNTYLLGRQVITRSTLQGYISALTRGCRCIEVDCWDGRDGQPIVKHGYSLTSSISFQDVTNTIKQYAFVQSDFPLWISLEVHCSAPQKAIMAQIMRETFGSSLVTEPLPGPSQPLPSPSQLRGKILIKTKIVHEVELLQNNQQPDAVATGCQTDSSSVSKKAEARAVLADLGDGDAKTSDGSSTVTSKSSSSLSQTSTFSNGPLEQLAVYGAGRRLPPLSQLDKQRNFIYSISEGFFKTQLKREDRGDFFSFLNLQHMLRVYPDATRVDSSNFHPLRYWRHGVQMVALNYQTDDLSMRINDAMFNGGTDNSGYVLKPERLRQSPELVLNQVKELHIMIDVIMTKDICWPKAYTRDATIYVEIEIMTADRDEDARRTKRPTRKVTIGHRDVIIDQSVDFSIKTSYPSLVFLQWSVKLSSDVKAFPRASVVASGIAKLENLKKGYQLLPLKRSFQDEEDCGYLFCKLDKVFCDVDVQ
ncbi:1-phosphatidylinositol-45-bisphosphate phosphodiesterase 1 [Fusarium albosuccineum]|uniref:Phosphoinositide phospholipase C n=1 Tax=Fusarium albosuccineum TaxID=1237068 RepID=A0A8H4LQX2_9HYPO|nr:1-phosphatidylinositol-45-bisphosphate phosphodiesterase 1 [Fusarium albosuccineum]